MIISKKYTLDSAYSFSQIDFTAYGLHRDPIASKFSHVGERDQPPLRVRVEEKISMRSG